MGTGKRFRVVLLRRNGRFVKEFANLSRYAAKKKRAELDEKYDSAFRTDVRPMPLWKPVSPQMAATS